MVTSFVSWSKRNTLIKEAIILAGGLGIRLREVVPDAPKCMAPVAGHPFLTYVIRHLLSQGIEKIVFSLGYKSEVILKFLQQKFSWLNYDYVIDDTPRGTGGAIALALSKTTARDVLVVNGDTLFKIDVDDLSDRHMENQSVCTLALKPMLNFDRYGVVEIDPDLIIKSFKEKTHVASGNINGGVYVINRQEFLKNNFPAVFSFEKQFLEQVVNDGVLTGVLQDKYFIDIGIPEDYNRAQQELKYPQPDFSKIDHTWTLFLDRDGVINRNKDESYVFTPDEFHFNDGALEALRILSDRFGIVVVLTNQRGIGKGLMDVQQLSLIHDHMINEINAAGGRIDALYYCPIVDDTHFDRKPNPGMALEAAHMFPSINFSKSIMVGDKMADMQLGRNIGAYTVMIRSSQSGYIEGDVDVDLIFDSLREFAEWVSGL